MEGENKITTVEKVKDPKRVAQGKRLAAISREAKARRAKEGQEQHQESEISSYLLLVPVIATVAFVGGYGYWFGPVKEEPKKEEPKKEEPLIEENSINRIPRLERL